MTATEPIEVTLAVTGASCCRQGRSIDPVGGLLAPLSRRAGFNEGICHSMTGWRSEEAQRIYANVDPEERQAAAKALVALVEKAS
jgi:hypothetical protein